MESATMVAGAAIAPLFQSLLRSLKSRDLRNFARQIEAFTEVSVWEILLMTTCAVLDNAELQRADEDVKIWLNDLRNLAYDMEDILDELQILAAQNRSLSPGRVSEMEETSRKLRHLIKRKDIINLTAIECKSNIRVNMRKTTPSLDEPQIYGREDQLNRILDQLKVETSDGRTPVISVTGMGGVGKTTLAKLVYNHPALQFDFKAWVFVGEIFDFSGITRTILQQLDGDEEEEEEEDFSYLQVKLMQKLHGKKFLLVLDDVWITHEDYDKWTVFYSPFLAGTPGSRIVVTTRNQSVSWITGAVDSFSVVQLPNDNCLSLLARYALGMEDFSQYPDLSGVGEKIAKKCNGLPLAVKAVGGFLHGERNRDSWEEVLNSKIWENIVLPHLTLSYYHLPSHLKRCFAYTAVFPKGYEFEKTNLVLLWMAEGFVMKMMDGYSYFDDLLARSFFQKSSSDESLYVMHDLINDLARSVSGNICFNLDEEEEKSYAEVRHSAFNCREYDVASRFERFLEMKHLRTFLALEPGWILYRSCYISPTVLDVMIERLKYLRSLALPYAISQLPASIDRLKHLRCLDLSYARVKMLPESLCKLFNLKALILLRCENLLVLPEDFCNLINLQLLDIRGTKYLKKMPLGIGDMKNLHILGEFVVGKSDGGRMLELLKIPILRGRQHISALQNARNVEDVKCWEMRKLEGIDSLTLEWSNEFDGSRNGKNEEEVLSALKPQKNIMELSIMSYGGRELPSWIGDPWFSKMKILMLRNSCNVASLPALGQLPSLEELTLEGMRGIKQVGMEFYGSVVSSAKVFPSLKILIIKHMEGLYEWSNYSIDEGRGHVFPMLKKLELNNCPKLEVCSLSFPNLDKLEVEGCKEVVLRSISNLTSLTELKISHISGLESLNGAFLEGLGSLQEMDVRLCDELKHLWEDEFNVEWLGCLKRLLIWSCKELVCLVEEEDGNFPLNLHSLNVFGCDKLKKLPNQLHSLTSFTDLRVSCCRKLESFPRRGLAYSVKRVRLEYCDSLVSLPEGITVDNNDNSNSGQMSQIEELTITDCRNLIVPSKLGFSTSLRRLEIGGSPVEAQFYRSLQLQNGLPHLTSLIIKNCSNLESFPDTIPPTLLSLSLWGCEKLRSLPNHMNQFTSLKSLTMYDCPEVAFFPEGGLPTDLKELAIAYCDKLESKVMLEQCLNALACLEILTIEVGGGMDDVSSFPHDSLLLSTSLTSLHISGFENLKSISGAIQRLSSLEELRIRECLQLESLPRVGLPPSLGLLNIDKCPILEERCRELKGDFWPLVASIPALRSSPSFLSTRSYKFGTFIPYSRKPFRLRKFPWIRKPEFEYQLGVEDLPLLKNTSLQIHPKTENKYLQGSKRLTSASLQIQPKTENKYLQASKRLTSASLQTRPKTEIKYLQGSEDATCLEDLRDAPNSPD